MTTAPAETEKRRLSGRLGPVGIVFMVVAAAAPLTVIGGNMPLAMGLGNGAGAPVGFVIAALVLLVFRTTTNHRRSLRWCKPPPPQSLSPYWRSSASIRWSGCSARWPASQRSAWSY
ncbi:hypothetical protein NCCNTM_40930 [Mycolicibacterium sp. NCC-Tsukiji]|nr:hypothetical protein NCCNTM_40930 [Mycolicibacterium sp. NCC-Tsukiji]